MKTLRILSVGNSFSVDTMEHLADIALSAGYTDVMLGNLYIGGCSVNQHCRCAAEDAPSYEYLQNDGNGWHSTMGYRMREALGDQPWDVVSIQNGTLDGSRNSDPASYERLSELVTYIRRFVSAETVVAFNMTWVGEPYNTHPEIVAYGGDCEALYQRIAAVMKDTVATNALIDTVSPTGTAIQNARTVLPFELTRDGYHLSLDVGRYIAGLTFFGALTDTAISAVSWAPEGVGDEVKAVCVAAAEAALKTPFAVTNLQEG